MGMARRAEEAVVSNQKKAHQFACLSALVLSLSGHPNGGNGGHGGGVQAAAAELMAYSLSKQQQRGLASILRLTLAEGEEATLINSSSTISYEERTRRCVESLVRTADEAFTLEATEAERSSLFSLDEGASVEALGDLRQRVQRRIKEELFRRTTDSDCEWSPVLETVLERASVALVRACLTGRSAHFALEQSVVDQFVEIFGASYIGLGVAIVLALALVGAYSFVDGFLAPRMLGGEEKQDLKKKVGRRSVLPCACSICERSVVMREKVGSGGFGAVWRCAVPKGAVVKLVQVDLQYDFNALRVVLDEAKHLLELQHNHIVAYFDIFLHRGALLPIDAETGTAINIEEDFWQLSNAPSTTLYDYACLAMEDCAGGTLLDHVAIGMAFPLSVVLTVTKQCADALAYAHDRGIVHRDVKLENIFVKLGEPGGPKVKIGDFGLAVRHQAKEQKEKSSKKELKVENSLLLLKKKKKNRSLSGMISGRSSSVGGTLAYQPPECFLSNNNEEMAALDAWGLGCALYEMTTCVSLPTESPYLGELLADPEHKTAHITQLNLNFDSSLSIAAAAAAAIRNDTPLKRNRRHLQIEGLRQLLRSLLAFDPERRPALAEVARADFLKDDAPLDFFDQGPKGGNKQQHQQRRGARSRAIRAKSMAQIDLTAHTRRAATSKP